MNTLTLTLNLNDEPLKTITITPSPKKHHKPITASTIIQYTITTECHQTPTPTNNWTNHEKVNCFTPPQDVTFWARHDTSLEELASQALHALTTTQPTTPNPTPTQL